MGPITLDFSGTGLVFLLSGVILTTLSLLRYFIRQEREIYKVAGKIFVLFLAQSFIFWVTSFFVHLTIRHLHFVVSHIIHTATFLSAGLYINKAIDLYFWKYFGENRIPTFVKGATAFLVYMLTIAAVIKFIFSQDEKAFVALTGGIALLLGYAATEVIKEVFSAFALNVTPAFKKGDVVTYDNKILHVQDMNWRFVTFIDRKNHSYYVPNTHLTSTSILNFSSQDGATKIELVFEVDLQADPDVVMEVIKKTFVKNQFFNKTKEIDIFLNAVQNSFEFIVHFPAIGVVDNHMIYQIKTELLLLLCKALKEQKIEFYQGVSYVRTTTLEY